jgi:hypothetical protein
MRVIAENTGALWEPWIYICKAGALLEARNTRVI